MHHQQNERFRRYYQRRSTPPVVDPKTGEFLDDEAVPTEPGPTDANTPTHPAATDAEVTTT